MTTTCLSADVKTADAGLDLYTDPTSETQLQYLLDNLMKVQMCGRVFMSVERLQSTSAQGVHVKLLPWGMERFFRTPLQIAPRRLELPPKVAKDDIEPAAVQVL